MAKLLALHPHDLFELRLHHPAEALETPALDQELEGRLVTVLSLPRAVLEPHDGLGIRQRLLGGQEVAQRQREVWHRTEPAAGEHAKAAQASLDSRVEGEIVDDSLRFVVGTA